MRNSQHAWKAKALGHLKGWRQRNNRNTCQATVARNSPPPGYEPQRKLLCVQCTSLARAGGMLGIHRRRFGAFLGSSLSVRVQIPSRGPNGYVSLLRFLVFQWMRVPSALADFGKPPRFALKGQPTTGSKCWAGNSVGYRAAAKEPAETRKRTRIKLDGVSI